MIIGIPDAVRQCLQRPGVREHLLLHGRNVREVLYLPGLSRCLMLPLCLGLPKIDGLKVICGNEAPYTIGAFASGIFPLRIIAFGHVFLFTHIKLRQCRHRRCPLQCALRRRKGIRYPAGFFDGFTENGNSVSEEGDRFSVAFQLLQQFLNGKGHLVLHHGDRLLCFAQNDRVNPIDPRIHLSASCVHDGNHQTREVRISPFPTSGRSIETAITKIICQALAGRNRDHRLLQRKSQSLHRCRADPESRKASGARCHGDGINL